MLATTLTTNEVKDAAGAEVEFQSLSINARTHVYAKSGETPALPHRLSVSHQETGNGIKKRRRSVIRVDKTSLSTVDSVTPVTTTAYVVLDTPVGAVTSSSEAAAVLANLMSFLASTGASTTILYDGTGNGAGALLSGAIQYLEIWVFLLFIQNCLLDGVEVYRHSGVGQAIQRQYCNALIGANQQCRWVASRPRECRDVSR